MIAKLLDRTLAACVHAANGLWFFTAGENLFYEAPVEDCGIEDKESNNEGSQS